jgi:hypothetical protein
VQSAPNIKTRSGCTFCMISSVGLMTSICLFACSIVFVMLIMSELVMVDCTVLYVDVWLMLHGIDVYYCFH